MYCNTCGKSIPDDAHFCNFCGVGVGAPHTARKLVRLRADRRIAGVCSGLGRYLDLDPIVVRLIWVFVTFVSGILPGIVVYILAWIIVPAEPEMQSVVPVGAGTTGHPVTTT